MKALLIIDIQNDFLPGGALAVDQGDQVIPIINELQGKFDLIVGSQDWHPADHGSFAANHIWTKPYQVIDLDGLEQTLWPIHCVQNSWGANFAKAIQREKWDRIFQKGSNPKVDSYSAFFDNGRREDTGLSSYLKEKGVIDVFICGLATDYCVKFSTLDALSEGFKTTLIADACRGVNISPEDSHQAIEEMKAAGAEVVMSSAL